MRILICSPSSWYFHAIRKQIHDRLSQMDIEITTVSDKEEVLKKWNATDYQLVILSMKFGSDLFSGINIIKSILRVGNPGLSKNILVYSSQIEPRIISQCKSLGVLGYVSKGDPTFIDYFAMAIKFITEYRYGDAEPVFEKYSSDEVGNTLANYEKLKSKASILESEKYKYLSKYLRFFAGGYTITDVINKHFETLQTEIPRLNVKVGNSKNKVKKDEIIKFVDSAIKEDIRKIAEEFDVRNGSQTVAIMSIIKENLKLGDIKFRPYSKESDE